MSLFLAVTELPLPALCLLIICMFILILILIMIATFSQKGTVRIIQVIEALRRLYYGAGYTQNLDPPKTYKKECKRAGGVAPMPLIPPPPFDWSDPLYREAPDFIEKNRLDQYSDPLYREAPDFIEKNRLDQYNEVIEQYLRFNDEQIEKFFRPHALIQGSSSILTNEEPQFYEVFDWETFRCNFGEITQSYRPELLKEAFNMVHDFQKAEDLVQESFLKIFIFLNNDFKTKNRPLCVGPFLFRAVVNTTINYMQREAKRPVLEERSQLLRQEKRNFPQPENYVLDNETRAILGNAIRQLSDVYCKIIILRFIEDYSFEQIAQKLKMKVGTVRVYQNRALKMLRKFITLEQHSNISSEQRVAVN